MCRISGISIGLISIASEDMLLLLLFVVKVRCEEEVRSGGRRGEWQGMCLRGCVR